MSELSLSSIQKSFLNEKVLFSLHARKEMKEEQFGIISLIEVVEVIKEGKIIEQYPLDTPFPSCLISGRTNLRPSLKTILPHRNIGT